MALHRIATLLSAATEIVADCGMAGQIVGRSHDSDYPAKAARIPVLTSPRISLNGHAREIDILNDALSVHQVDMEMLKELKPDLIITQCRTRELGVSISDLSKAVSDYIGSDVKVLSIAPESLDEVIEAIEIVSLEIGAPHMGTRIAQAMSRRLEAVKEKLLLVTERSKPTVVCLENFNPLTTVGHWIPEMVRMAGAHDPFSAETYHTRFLTWDRIAEADPNKVIMIPYGQNIQGAGVAMRMIDQVGSFRNLRAFKSRQVYVLNGSTYFNRPGPRVVEGFEILAEIFHPEVFSYKYMGTGWAEYM